MLDESQLEKEALEEDVRRASSERDSGEHERNKILQQLKVRACSESDTWLYSHNILLERCESQLSDGALLKLWVNLAPYLWLIHTKVSDQLKI